jgi:hypothetical protein
MGLVGELCTWMEFLGAHPARIMSLSFDTFSASLDFVRKYEPTLKPGYMAAYGSHRFWERFS